jgi:hypothetical protein
MSIKASQTRIGTIGEVNFTDDVMFIGLVLRGQSGEIATLLEYFNRDLPSTVEIVSKFSHPEKLVIKIEE